jgi:hypothetical protein
LPDVGEASVQAAPPSLGNVVTVAHPVVLASAFARPFVHAPQAALVPGTPVRICAAVGTPHRMAVPVESNICVLCTPAPTRPCAAESVTVVVEADVIVELCRRINTIRHSTDRREWKRGRARHHRARGRVDPPVSRLDPHAAKIVLCHTPPVYTVQQSFNTDASSTGTSV